MKGIILLVVILGAILGVMGIVIESPGDKTEVAGVMGVVFLVVVGLALRGPLGRAIANLLGAGDDTQAQHQAALTAQLDAVMEDLRQTREEILELQERVDFTERLLAQGQQDRLGSGREP